MKNKIKPQVWGGLGEKKSNSGRQWYQQNRIYDTDYVALSITASFLPYYIMRKDKVIKCGAIRGRPNCTGKNKQQLEVNDREVSNTITTVQKDNVIIEYKTKDEVRCHEQ